MSDETQVQLSVAGFLADKRLHINHDLRPNWDDPNVPPVEVVIDYFQAVDTMKDLLEYTYGKSYEQWAQAEGEGWLY